MNAKELREQYELNVGRKVLVIDGTTVDGYIRHLESRLIEKEKECEKLQMKGGSEYPKGYCKQCGAIH